MRRARMALLSALVVTFALIGGGMAEARHRWYKWATKDGVVDLHADLAGLGDWAQETSQVLEDWDSSPRVVIDTNPAGKQGRVTLASGSYPRSGWLGLAMVELDSRRRITGGRVLLNEWYWTSGLVEGARAGQHVLCQEVGHTIGLGHQRGPSCMNDSGGTLGDWVRPDRHDYEQLATMYGQLDGYESGTLSGSSGNARRVGAATNWVVVHVYPAPTTGRTTAGFRVAPVNGGGGSDGS